VGKRRKAREFALQILFQIDITDKMGGENFSAPMELFWATTQCKEEIKDFSQAVVRGTLKHLDQIDGYIKKFAVNWDMSRMPAVDRNILRLAIYEMLFKEDIPLKVTINEAIELAKSYGTEDSARFINGLLDNFANKILPDTEK